MNSLIGFSMESTDGAIGEVTDFYFDDQTWVMVYLIVKTGHWLSGRKVLISSYSLRRGMGWPGNFPVDLTREQIANSPDIDTDKPVSRQQEVELYGHYTWQDSWGSGFYAGGFSSMADQPVIDEKIIREADKKDKRSDDDLHLRSMHVLLGYHIETTDGERGHVRDFIIDDETWHMEYLVIELHHGPGGRQVLVACRHIKEVQWETDKVLLDVTSQVLKDSPAFEEAGFSYDMVPMTSVAAAR
jgi:sporulation protein YlmC with PRC-barrel domain